MAQVTVQLSGLTQATQIRQMLPRSPLAALQSCASSHNNRVGA
tara:strand:+ start:1814 stop:1942 length:129 start_codon:yes stop_codon:yes gene_type:complete